MRDEVVTIRPCYTIDEFEQMGREVGNINPCRRDQLLKGLLACVLGIQNAQLHAFERYVHLADFGGLRVNPIN